MKVFVSHYSMLEQHSGAGVSTVASQQEGVEFLDQGISVRSLHVLPVPVSLGVLHLHPTVPKHGKPGVRLIGHSKLP